jgi:hypothetical protein
MRRFDNAADHQIRMGCLIFPYEFVFELIDDYKLMNEFIPVVLQYSPATHIDAIRRAFG